MDKSQAQSAQKKLAVADCTAPDRSTPRKGGATARLDWVKPPSRRF